MDGLFKLLNVFLVSSVKFAASPAYSFLVGLDYWETIIVTSLGGIIGFVFFYLVAKFLIYEVHFFNDFVTRYFPNSFVNSFRKIKSKTSRKKPKKIFTRKNRTIVRVMNKYGMGGIVVLTPVLLSIPVGAFLSYRYYSRRKRLIPLMVIAIIAWAFVISSIVSLVPGAA